jgi:hypothetical protein
MMRPIDLIPYYLIYKFLLKHNVIKNAVIKFHFYINFSILLFNTTINR